MNSGDDAQWEYEIIDALRDKQQVIGKFADVVTEANGRYSIRIYESLNSEAFCGFSLRNTGDGPTTTSSAGSFVVMTDNGIGLTLKRRK